MSVRDIPDDELLRRAVSNAKPNRIRSAEPRWVSVSRQFALGSTYSRELCQRFGLNPDEERKGR